MMIILIFYSRHPPPPPPPPLHCRHVTYMSDDDGKMRGVRIVKAAIGMGMGI